MGWNKRLKGFLKHGKFDVYSILVKELGENGDKNEIADYLNDLTSEQSEKLINEMWDKVNHDWQSFLAERIYEENWSGLLDNFKKVRESEQVRIIEILACLEFADNINFLVEQLCSKKESISFAAMEALKKQNPELVLKPVLQQINTSKWCLPTRLIEVLKGVEKKELFNSLQEMLIKYPKTKSIVVEILSELGDQECLDLFASLLSEEEPLIRKRIAEALKHLKIKESMPLLLKLLNDSFWIVRMPAIQALVETHGKGALPYLQMRMQVEEEDILIEVMQEAIVGMGEEI